MDKVPNRRFDSFIYSLAEEKNEFFVPRAVYKAKSAIHSYLLSDDSIHRFLTEVEDLYGTDLEKIQEKNRGLKIGVIMAGNIPGVGFSDLFCTLALGFTAIVKLSSKDSYFMWYLIQNLHKAFPEFSVTVTEDIVKEVKKGYFQGVVFAGSDQSKAQIEKELNGIPLLARGTKFSFGVVLPQSKLLSPEPPKGEYARLVQDCAMYFGLGCRSITYLFVPKGFNWSKFLKALSREFASSWTCEGFTNAVHRRVAIAKISGTKIIRYSDSINEDIENAKGEFIIDMDNILLHHTRDAFPPLGVINFQIYDNVQNGEIEEVREFEERYGDKIQEKYTNFGKAQYPLLTDWQDGISTVKFLRECGLK